MKRTAPAAGLAACFLMLVMAWAGAPASALAQDIEVTSADPSSAPQGTINLNVTIKGKGFKKGAVARFFVTGTTNPGGITVKSTSFVNSSALVTNIDIDDQAVIDKFDIEVMSGGRTGKGTELFSVTEKGGGPTCETSPLPDGVSLVATLNTGSFTGEFGRAIAVESIELAPGAESLVAAIGSRISGSVEVFLLPATGAPVDHVVSLALASADGPKVVQGDANGDSLPDIVVGQPTPGTAHVFLAQVVSGLLSYGPAIPLLPPPGEDKTSFGEAVAIGDVDGDIGNEVLIGARAASVGGISAAGKVFVFAFDDSNESFTFTRVITRPGPKKGDYFGASLTVWDVVGDTSPDLIVGAFGVDGGAGARDVGQVFVFPGPLSLGTAPVELTRSVKGEGLGYRVAAADVDGDGTGDVAATGYLKPPMAVFTGLVSSGQAPEFVLEPEPALAGGYATNVDAGDVNGDGRADLLLAAPNAPDNVTACSNTGAAYLYLSGSGRPLSSRLLLQAPDAGQGLYGWAVAAGPGSRVFLVGEPKRSLGGPTVEGQVYVYRLP